MFTRPIHRTSMVIAITTAVVIVALTAIATAGYTLESSWSPSYQVFTYHVYSGHPSDPGFRDFHLVWGDEEHGHFEVIELPAGWQSLERVHVTPWPPRRWLSFYGDYPLYNATFRVRYTGARPISDECEWLLSEDGNTNPGTGTLPGEGGANALAPVNRGANVDLKVGVHVLPHSDLRTCSREFPVITCPSADISTTCPDGDVDFFPVFFDMVEYQCLEYGVSWPGTYSCAFTSCSYLQIGDIVWPAGTVDPELRLDGISHSWQVCTYGTTVIPGFGWIYEKTGRLTASIVMHMLFNIGNLTLALLMR